MTLRQLFAPTLCAATLMASAASQTSVNVGFDGGSNGDFTGNFFFEAAGGNPDGKTDRSMEVNR